MARNLVAFMDRSLLVLNKPAGLVAQGGRHALGPKRQTLEYVLEDLKNSLLLETKPYPVHRLDKLTTGAFILARNPRTAQTLNTHLRQPTSKHITKTYLALVHGACELNRAGEIRTDLYITDGKVSAREPPIEDNYKRKPSYTIWRCLASGGGISLVELGLRTGVKHQLRISMAKILDAPILGDPIYGLARSNDQQGLMLHSARIEILRYLRKPAFGNRTYRLGVTVPPPANFLDMCQRSGLSIAPEWLKSPVCVTINGSEIPYEHSSILYEETVIEALKKFHRER